MHRRTILPLLLVAVMAILLLSCKEEDVPTTPGPTGPDTTSHNVSWTIIDTLGDRHSYFIDVCAVNDTCVYAVGKMFMGYDSSGRPIKYNVARWDGSRWNRLMVETRASSGSAMVDGIRTVFAFGENDIWLAGERSGYAHWDGSRWTHGHIQNSKGSVYRIYGLSPDEVYFFCTGGGITRRTYVHNAEKWEFIESGTTKDINDAWGVGDTIFALACSVYSADYFSEVIQIVDGTVAKFSDENLDWNLKTIWCSPTGKKIVTGSQYEEWRGDKWWGYEMPSDWFLEKMRGNHDYDIWGVGHGASVVHFNGKSWAKYPEISDGERYMFYGVACIPGNVWVVGSTDNDQSVILHGRY